MKIGIMTSNASFMSNYGAALQAYALSYQLKLWGYDAEIINYRYNTGSQVVEANRMACIDWKDKVKYILQGEGSFKQKVMYRRSRVNRTAMREIFRKFTATYLPIDLDRSMDIDALRQTDLQYDAYICGSDQVWNPLIHNNRNDPGFFLDFVPMSSKKIAYAPSFGISSLPQGCNASLREYLNTFDAISVREETGAKIIRDVCGCDVPVVLDPTMMADPCIWNAIAKMPEGIPEKYILCYRFGKMPYASDMIKKIAKQQKLPVIELPLSMESYGKGTMLCFNASPAEFVGLIRNAEIILTDSFHATVFSIMNHKPFYTFLREGKDEKDNMNSRIENILKTMELSDQLIYPETELACNKEVYFGKADEIISEKRMESQDYLIAALGDFNAD